MFRFILRYFHDIEIAVESIVSNKLKSMLTALGIIFGVAAVIAMLAIGKGAKQEKNRWQLKKQHQKRQKKTAVNVTISSFDGTAINPLLAVHIFKPPTLSKIFGLRRVKAKTPIKANNNNQTEKDKGVCEARLID